MKSEGAPAAASARVGFGKRQQHQNASYHDDDDDTN